MAESDQGRDRRRVLQGLGFALGGVFVASALSHFFRRPTQRRPRPLDLPGEGSIFQPRRDARLEEWERRHGAISQ